MKLINSKKGVIDQLQPMVIALVAVGLVLVVGFLIVAQVKEQVRVTDGLDSKGSSATHPNGSSGWNASISVQNALDDIPDWLPIIVITVIGALLIGLVSLFRRR